MKILSIFFYCIYAYINYNFTIIVAYTNIIKQIIGMIVVVILGAFLDGIAYRIAYFVTRTTTSRKDGYFFRSTVHWFIRGILWVIITILGKSGLFVAILTPLIQWISTNYQNQIDKLEKVLKNLFSPQ